MVNLTWFPIVIDDWRIDDQPVSGSTNDQYDFPVGTFLIDVGDRAILADSSNGTVTPLATWATVDFTLDDLDGGGGLDEAIRFRRGSLTIHSIRFLGSSWNFTPGHSAELSESALVGALAGVTDPDNSASTSWCNSASPGGTPGTVNSCP